MYKRCNKNWNDRHEHSFNCGWCFVQEITKKCQSNELLQFSDLPQFIMYHGNCFTIREYKVRYGSMSTEDGIDGLGLPLESKLNAVLVTSRQNACIVIFNSVSFAI